jgi:hypothetical protein
MSDIGKARKAVVTRVLEGDGAASRAQRHAAFANTSLEGPVGILIENVAKHAYKVTDEMVAAARTSGLSEDQIFELVVCAALGEATRQYETALAALEAASARG